MLATIKRGLVRVGSGVEHAMRSNLDSALVVQQVSGKYAEAVREGRVFVACNQAAVAVTAAMATTYTGLVLFNPATSVRDLVLLGFGYAANAAVPAATCIGLMTGVNAGDAATAITPRNRLIGGPASVAIVDNGCTLTGTPVLEQVFSYAFAEATTAGTVGPQNSIDLEGSLILLPNTYVAAYSTAALTAAMLFWFMWEEVPRG